MLVVRIIAFQAEYEGSIPFTRSSDFNGLTRAPAFIPTAGRPYYGSQYNASCYDAYGNWICPGQQPY
jgi:hypothetical protein